MKERKVREKEMREEEMKGKERSEKERKKGELYIIKWSLQISTKREAKKRGGTRKKMLSNDSNDDTFA